MERDKKRKAVEVALESLKKEFGSEVAYFLGDTKKDHSISALSSGSYALDCALGVGGYPRGRIVEMFGSEGGGKTTMLLLAIAQAQREGEICAFIDAEHSLDIERAKQLGVNFDSLIFSQPDNGEEALEVVDQLVRSHGIGLIGTDSVAALVTKAELEGTMENKYIGILARLIGQALKKLTAVISKSNTVCIFINQLREKPGIVFGNPETTPGGRALKFYSSVRISVNKGSTIKEEAKSAKVVYGHIMNINIVKNKVAPPYERCNLTLYYKPYKDYPVGINTFQDIFNASLIKKIIVCEGKSYQLLGKKIGSTVDDVINILKTSDKIRNLVIDKLKGSFTNANNK